MSSRDPSLYRHSPRIHTVWQVVSKPVANVDYGDTMPVLQLDYEVATNLAGDARGGPQTLRLSAGHLPGVAGAGAVRGATLAVSYDDGRTWHRVDLNRSGDGWDATFTAPMSGFVSVKASAWDSVGNRMTQEVTRAYGLTANP